MDLYHQLHCCRVTKLIQHVSWLPCDYNSSRECAGLDHDFVLLHATAEPETISKLVNSFYSITLGSIISSRFVFHVERFLKSMNEDNLGALSKGLRECQQYKHNLKYCYYYLSEFGRT